MALSIHPILVAIVALQANAPAPVRVSMADAKAHIVHKVDPVVPPEAAAARIGGTVSAEIVIRTSGAVETVTILAGHEMLHAAATAAVKRWAFKPFVVGGRPVRAVAIVDIPFPDPRADEERARSDAYWNGQRECVRLIEARDAAAAERVCRETVAASEKLPADRLLERSRALDNLAQALILSGRGREAIAEFEKGLAIRRKVTNGRPDADEAATLGLIATLQGGFGEIAAAEKNFAASVDMFQKAIELSPTMAERYASWLTAVLRQYSAFKRSIADRTAAEELDRKAAALETKKPAPFSTAARRVGSVVCVGPRSEHLRDDDIRQVRAVLSAQRGEPWVVHAAAPEVRGQSLVWQLTIYLKPQTGAGRVRHGQTRLVSATLASATDFEAPRSWRVEPLEIPYSQLPESGRDATEILSAEDPNLPFETGPSASASLTDDDIVAIVTAVRAAAVPTREDPPRLSNDVQPWPVRSVTKWDDARATATLVDPRTSRRQFIEFRRVEGKWAVSSKR